jgi:TRAP-type mannitol/chloroaromatic compound transport system substrate-binding protein
MIISSPSMAQEKKFKLRGQSCFGLASPLGQHTIVLWKKMAEEMSGGRLSIELFDAGAVVPPAEVFDAVRQGVLDLGLNTPAWQKGKYPAGDLFYTLPGGVLQFNDLLIWMYGDEGIKLQQEMYGKDIIVFPLGLTPPEEMWTKKPVKTLADLKGMKIRSAGLGMEVLEKLGASVVILPGGEVLPALQRGVIDGAEFLDASMDYNLGLHEVAKFRFGPPIHMSNNIFQLVINPKKWQELPDDLKAIVKYAAMAATIQGYSTHWMQAIEANKKLEAAGITTTKLSSSEQEKARQITMEILDKKAAADPYFAKVWNSQKQFLNKYQPYDNLTKFDK